MIPNKPVSVPMGQINPDPTGIQPRSQLNQDAVERYAAGQREGDEQPAIELMEIMGETKYRIVDGYHRYAARQSNKSPSIRATVIKGTLLQARERAFELNTRHGVPLSSSERRLALLELLDEYQLLGVEKSLQDISNITGVPKSTVGRIVGEWKQDKEIPTSLGEQEPTQTAVSKPSEPFDRPNGTVIHNDEPTVGDGLNDEEPIPSSAGHIVLHDSSLMFSELLRQVTLARTTTGKLSALAGGEALARHQSQLERALTEVAGVVRSCTPMQVCDACDGQPPAGADQCPVCKGTLILCAEQVKQREQDAQTGLVKRT